MMRVLSSAPTALRRTATVVVFSACLGAISVVGHAGQARTVTAGVYSDAQAARGQQAYESQCVACHGKALEGAVGPPLAGSEFLSVWSARSLNDLVDKIEKTMPPQAPGSVSRQQAVDLVAHLLRAGKFPSGQTDLSLATLGQIAFPAASAASAASSTGASTFAVAGNLAQLMRGVTFPNANILFNVQVKDPAKEKPAMPIPFDYVVWGGTVYYGWQAVDQAALALIETYAAVPVTRSAVRKRASRSGRSRRLEAVHQRAHGRGTSGLQGSAIERRRGRQQDRRTAE